MKVRKCILGIGIICALALNGCGLTENDLDRLEGTWKGTWNDNQENGLVIYEPSDKDKTSGDAEIISNGERFIATYEWHESSKRLIFTYVNWGNTVRFTYEYELLNDTKLNMADVEYSDYINTYTYSDEEATVYEFVKQE